VPVAGGGAGVVQAARSDTATAPRTILKVMISPKKQQPYRA
jgi:hypothetical protein